MAFTLDLVRADIKAELLSNLAHDRVYHGGIPTLATLKRVGTQLRPYVIFLNSTLRRWPTGGSFEGARGDDHYVVVDFLSIAADPVTAESQQSRIIDRMLGYKPEHAGELSIVPGVGGTFTVQTESGMDEAYIAPVSFRCSLDVLTVS